MFINIRKLLKRLLRKKTLVIYLLSLAYILSFLVFFDDIKIMFIITLAYCFLIFLVIKDIFIAIFFALAISNFFYFPLKRYEIQLIPGRYLFGAGSLFRQGLLAVYGVNVSDVLTFLLISLTLGRVFFLRERLAHFFILIRKSKLVLGVLFCWTGYCLIAFFSSTYYSAFPEYSTAVSLQSSKMLVMLLATAYAFSKKEKQIFNFYIVVFAVLTFQTVFALLSLLLKGQNINILLGDPELTFIPRATSLIGHPNLDALFSAVLLIFLLPFFKLTNKIVVTLSFLFVLASIIFFQSRTIWLGIGLAFLPFIRILPREFIDLKRIIIKKIKKISKIGFIVGAVLSVIIVERLINSGLFFTSYGGGGLRLIMLKEGIEAVQESPFWGYGTQLTVVELLNRSVQSYTSYFPVSIHLVPLEIAVESGVVAVLLFLIPFYLYMRQAVIHIFLKKNRNLDMISLMMIIIVISVYFLLNPTDNYRRDFLLFGMVFGRASAQFLYMKKTKKRKKYAQS